jgi:pyruvate/2-oxoglutarate dehydrogenase complex dihydrolipoamide acyltransferase (E2) component
MIEVHEMIYKAVVPDVGEDVQEIRVLQWHGAPGHRFAVGELVVELETHKALVEMRAGRGAILRQILTDEGDWTPIGGPIALFSDYQDEPLPDSPDAVANLEADFAVD